MILLTTFCKNYFCKIFIFTLLIKLYKVKNKYLINKLKIYYNQVMCYNF